MPITAPNTDSKILKVFVSQLGQVNVNVKQIISQEIVFWTSCKGLYRRTDY